MGNSVINYKQHLFPMNVVIHIECYSDYDICVLVLNHLIEFNGWYKDRWEYFEGHKKAKVSEGH